MSKPPVNQDVRTKRVFHQFSQLNDELVTNILSYIADIPYQISSFDYTSTLTSTLPLVSKKFHSICKNGFLWEIALTSLVVAEADLWGTALHHFIEEHASVDMGATLQYMRQLLSSDEDLGKTNSKLLVAACGSMQEAIIDHGSQVGYGFHSELYRWLLCNHVRYYGPVFYMPDEAIQRGTIFGLHFFEPRYRRLIREVMEPYPDEFKEGTEITEENGITSPPTFIYANRSPLKRGQAAIVVQVLQCVIHDNGAADVFLRPIQHLHVELVWTQNDMSDHLYFARGKRMREEEQDQLEANDHMRRYLAAGGVINS